MEKSREAPLATPNTLTKNSGWVNGCGNAHHGPGARPGRTAAHPHVQHAPLGRPASRASRRHRGDWRWRFGGGSGGGVGGCARPARPVHPLQLVDARARDKDVRGGEVPVDGRDDERPPRPDGARSGQRCAGRPRRRRQQQPTADVPCASESRAREHGRVYVQKKKRGALALPKRHKR